MTRLHTERQGAALVVAIAVLTLLLAIALTFFTVSRLELKTVTNIENTVRAEFLADAALNIGISFLSQDTRDHPTVTSLDHAWRTYFNGAWIQGKLWAFPDQWATWPPEPLGSRYNGIDDDGDGVVDDKPGLEMLDVPTIFFTEEEGPLGSIAGGGGIGHVYYPRYEIQRNAYNRPSNLQESAYTLDNNPFLVDPEGQRDYDGTLSDPFPLSSPIPAAYQVERWADIDNDGDGLRDSMWIPLASDTLVGNTVDAETHEILLLGDGMDNDLDERDPTCCPCQVAVDGSEGTDEPDETAVFLYYGGNDGLDNDNINAAAPTVDDAAEQRWFLTAPICSLDSLDAANDFYLTLHNVCIPGMGAVDINTDPLLGWPNRWVDVLDNDYDLVHNKHFEYYTAAGNWTWPTTPPYNDATTYPDPVHAWNLYIANTNTNPPHPPLPIRVLSNVDFDSIRGVQEISHDRYLGTDFPWRVKSAGEPVSEIVGRAAILINDEASKVNVNIAGGHTLDLAAVIEDNLSALQAGERPDYWTPATASALSTSQYCTRVLPDFGVERSRKLWNLLTGAPYGSLAIPPLPQNGDAYPPTIGNLADLGPTVPSGEYVMDALSPGYGLVDDNANSLMLAMNGIDDDGDGMIDEGVNPAYPEYLGLFEGVDDPGELQRLNPYRNLVAEGKLPMSDGRLDNVDDDRNDATNERGELGDRGVRTREESKRLVANEYWEDPLRPGTTRVPDQQSFYDELKSFVTLHSTDKNNRFTGAVVSNPLLPADPIRSQADSRRVSSGLKVDYNYAPAVTIARAFVDDWGLTTPTSLYAYDNRVVEAADIAFATGLQQEGVNVALEREVNGSPWGPVRFADDLGNPIPYPADPQLRALQLATNIVDGRDADYARTTETMTVKDTWWEGESGGQQRNITYTIAGCEGIRITEMMIRPVRRVEAEMLKFLGPDSANPETGQTPYFCPNMFSQYALPQDIANPPNPFPFTEKPDFDMMRTYFEEMIPAQGSMVPSGYTGYWLQFADPDFFDDPNTKPVPPLQPPALPYPYWYRNSQILPNIGGGDGVIGSDSVLTTTRATIPVLVRQFEDGRVVDERPEQWPNIIQFRFGPGPGLPPGKYYLTINTTTAQINPATGRPYVTVDDQARDQIRFAVKYTSATGNNVDMPLRSDMTPMTVGLQDILSDVRAAYLADVSTRYDFYNDPNSPFSLPPPDVSAPRVAGVNPGEPPGWVFLPTVDDAMIGDGYGQDEGFTVTIPPYATDTQNQAYLYVAICAGEDFAYRLSPAATPERDYLGNPYGLTPNGIDDDGDGVIDDGPLNLDGTPNAWGNPETNVNGIDDDGDGVADDWMLSINFFDFSQEPDHEWVEIENVTGHAVDISGWTLTVGGVDKEGKVVTTDRVDMRIPDIMTLNPNNPVILESRPPNNRLILAADLNEYQVTNNIFMNNGMGIVGVDMTPVLGPDFSEISSPKPSSFSPWAWPERDYPGNPYGLTPNGIDDDGDGVIDDGPADPAGSPEAVALQANGIDDDNDGFIDDSATSAGICPFDNMYAARRVVQVEIDGLTNAGAVTSVKDVAKWVLRGGVFPDYPEHDGIDNDYDNTMLTSDGVDNNGNNSLLRSNLLDDDGDGLVDYPDDPLEGVDEPYEGVDEGWYRTDTKWPVYSALGIAEWWARALPGGFNLAPVQFTSAFFDYNHNPLDPLENFQPPVVREYLAATNEPPEWKEFVERRFFPGDNVIVTLFEGSPDKKRVVDRVTYTERDVINRSIDEGPDLLIPIDVDGNHGRATLYEKASGGILPIYLTFWPDNTMMLDFYRTLERKHHPLYNGDRFGTSNRWEATDGNYDDWSHFPVAFNSPNFNGTPLARNDATFPLPLPDPNPIISNVFNMNPEEADLAYLGYAPIENFDGSQAADRFSRDWRNLSAQQITANWGIQPNIQAGACIGTGVALTSSPNGIMYNGPPLPGIRSEETADSRRWKDYRFRCDFRPVEPLPANYDIGFVFRWSRDENGAIRYYLLRVSQRTDPTTLLVRTFYSIIKHWSTSTPEVMLAPFPVVAPDDPVLGRLGPPLPAIPLLMEVRVEGDHVLAVINGVVLETWDNEPLETLLNDRFQDGRLHGYIPEGTVGLYCQGQDAHVAFENVYVITRDKERDHPYTSPGDALAQPYLALNRVFTYPDVRDSVTYDQFSMSQDFLVRARDVVSGAGEKAVEFPRGLRAGDSYPLDEDAIVSMAAEDRVLLTCGQAKFYLLYPRSDWNNLGLDATTWATYVSWLASAQPGEPWSPPQAWCPVFTYPLLSPPESGHKYPIYDAGNRRFVELDLTADFLFINRLALYNSPYSGPMGWLASERLLSRYGYVQNPDGTVTWRKDPRIVMYVSANLATFDGRLSRPEPSTGVHNVDAAEALFEWNAEDGLENGQYDVYLDMGRYDERLREGPLMTLGQALYVAGDAGAGTTLPPLFENTRPEEQVVDVELFTDRDGDAQCWNGSVPTWQNLDRQETTNPDGSITPADSFGQKQGLTPGLDGYIHYDVVRVENHYLALYLRNWAKYGRANRFFGLILTPRDRTSGRININTVETKAYSDKVTVNDVSREVYRGFNALLGVPGVLFDEGQQYIAPDGAPTPPILAYKDELPEGALPPLPGLPQIQIDPPLPLPATNLLDRARLIEVGRPGTRSKAVYPTAYLPGRTLDRGDYPNRQDGRYYASVSELVSPDSEFEWPPLTGLYLHPLTTEPPMLDMLNARPFPDNPQWNDEIGTRFGKMSNLITTRSDVFEILVTVQAGYAVDANGDGQINWRSNDEFIVTAEKKARSVYER